MLSLFVSYNIFGLFALFLSLIPQSQGFWVLGLILYTPTPNYISNTYMHTVTKSYMKK